MATDPAYYTEKIPSCYEKAENWTRSIAYVTSCLIAVESFLEDIQKGFDLPLAKGKQLDVIGRWVGVSREVYIKITGVYFNFRDKDVTWGKGVWKGKFDPDDAMTSLDDSRYRTLIQFTILKNKWDGTITGAYAIYDAVFQEIGIDVTIEDHQNMSITYIFSGADADQVIKSLIEKDYFTLKPMGVQTVVQFQ